MNPRQKQELERVVREENTLLVRWLTKKLGDPDAARDVAQSVYLRVWAYAEREHITYPRALLFRTAANLACNELKRRNRYDRRHVSPNPETGYDPADNVPCALPTPEQSACLRQDVAAALAAIKALPERPRRAFILSRFEGLTYREIAARLGVSESSVEKYLIEALRTLRRTLGPGKGGDVVRFPGRGFSGRHDGGSAQGVEKSASGMKK